MARRVDVITDIEAEMVQEITAASIEAEGIDISDEEGISAPNHFRGDCWELFKKLWDSINAKRGYPYRKNPAVWVLSFKKVI